MLELEAKVFGKGKLSILESQKQDKEKTEKGLKHGEVNAKKLVKEAKAKTKGKNMKQWDLTGNPHVFR